MPTLSTDFQTVESLLDSLLDHLQSIIQDNEQFHVPTEDERSIMSKYGADSVDCNIGYQFQGNFTVCVIVTRSKQMSVGVTKRNCQLDKVYDVTRAKSIALHRALKNRAWGRA